VKDIPPLLRALTRVELRCTTAAERPHPLELLKSDALAGLAGQGIAPAPLLDASNPVRLRALNAELTRRERQSGASAPALLPVLIELGDNNVLPSPERTAHLRRAMSIARTGPATPALMPYLTLALHGVEQSARRGAYKPVDWSALVADPAIQASPRASAAVRIFQVETLAQKERRESAKPMLQQVVAMPGLAATDPLKVAALLRLSSLELTSGNAEAARASFAATGLSAQQCALIDPGPVKSSGHMRPTDFPMEAARWGFEGFVQLEYDITPEGRVVQVRPTVAYPPFTFGKAAAKGIERFEYDPSYRPGGSIACGGNKARIRFLLPD
jgi:hypothetical protein